MKKKPKVFLARDKIGGLYVIRARKKPRRGRGHIWGHWEGDHDVCSYIIEALASKSCHLKPGEGPIEIDITIRRKKP